MSKAFWRPPEHLIGKDPNTFTRQDEAELDASFDAWMRAIRRNTSPVPGLPLSVSAVPLTQLGLPADAELSSEWLLKLLSDVYAVDGARLILERRDRGTYVQLAVDAGDLVVETTSNVHRDAAHQLSTADEAALVALGWRPPLAKDDVGGGIWSPNWFRFYEAPAPLDEAAALVYRTLTTIVGCRRVEDVAVRFFIVRA